MTRVAMVLLVMVLLSSVFLVQVRYESRRLTTQIDRVSVQARELKIERRRLEVERRAQATSLRVEQLAQDELSMRSITPAITEYVDGVPTAAITKMVKP